jgi:DNA helicase HerA-like ATPase
MHAPVYGFLFSRSSASRQGVQKFRGAHMVKKHGHGKRSMVEQAILHGNGYPGSRESRGIGTVISYASTPDIHEFHFIVSNGFDAIRKVKVGKYVCVKENDGLVVGQVMNLVKINEYFLNANTIKESRPQVSFTSIFPVDQWEYVLAQVNVVGFYPLFDLPSKEKGNRPANIEKSLTPVSPGSIVQAMDPLLLDRFLGFTPDGLYLGIIDVDEIPVRVDLAKLFQKHLAILAMSGAGKSYLVSVLLEEIMKAKTLMPPVIIVDTHGEYSAMFNASNVATRCPNSKVEIVNGSFFQIATPFLTSASFFNYMPNMSHVQGRDLMRVFNQLRESKKSFNLRDLVAALQADEKLGKKTRDALEGWIYQLEQFGMFAQSENPRIDEMLEPNTIIVLDMSGLTSSKQKQIIVDYIASRAFYLRKNRSVPPFVLIIEEAHQFVPQAAAENAIARHILETIAREGRKFFASLCLISQRPVNLNTTVLSQCNTQVILRVSNPNDLDHIRASSEKITGDALKMISSLPVGSAILVGSVVNVPVFFKVRPREFMVDGKEGVLAEELAAFSREK